MFREWREIAAGLQPQTAPIPLLISGLGQVGHLSHRHGVYINSAYRRHILTLAREEARIERVCREESAGLLGAAQVLAAAQRIGDACDGIRAAKSVLAAISSWDAVQDAMTIGKSLRVPFMKSPQQAFWVSMVSTAGLPPAATYTNIPGGALMNANTTGALTLPRGVTSTEQLYLLNLLCTTSQVVVVLLVDVLVNAANISATSTVSQNISSTALSRWTTGEGLAMTLEVTTVLGVSAANITISYTNQAGTAAKSTGAIAMFPQALVEELQPRGAGPMIRLAANDYGVRSVEGCIFSASMGGGVLAALIYKPLVAVSHFHALALYDRSTPAQTGAIRALKDGVGGELPFLGFFARHGGGAAASLGGEVELFWGVP